MQPLAALRAEKLARLLKLIGSYAHHQTKQLTCKSETFKRHKFFCCLVSEQSEVSAQSEVLSTPPPMQEAKKRVLSWKKEDVAKWLESIGFDV